MRAWFGVFFVICLLSLLVHCTNFVFYMSKSSELNFQPGATECSCLDSSSVVLFYSKEDLTCYDDVRAGSQSIQ